MNHLEAANCNKKCCHTCMFNEEGKPIELGPGRREEIETYLRTFQSSHVCHTTNKTCYGGLKIQAEMLFRLGIISENTVDCLLETASKTLNLTDETIG